MAPRAPFPATYLSRPAVLFPGERLSNVEVIERIFNRFRGDSQAWQQIEDGIRRVFELCHSEHRFIDADPDRRVADYAVRCAEQCLAEHDLDPRRLDLLIYGGIAREYFEPATAMEVAGKLGVEEIHAFDVTSACAGQLEGVQIATAYMNLRDDLDLALVCAGELTRTFLSYEIQRPEELIYKVAGLTIGNAAAAWLVGRRPFPGGCLRLLGMRNYSLPRHWGLCQAPIDGSFTSYSHELFKLNVHVAPELRRLLDEVGWQVGDVDHFVFHQPSESMIRKVLDDLGADAARAVFCHHLYGNTASTTVAVTLHQLLAERRPRPGDKLVLATAAAGFTMVSAAAEWVG